MTTPAADSLETAKAAQRTRAEPELLDLRERRPGTLASLDDDALRGHLALAVSEATGRSVTFSSIRRRPCSAASSYPAESVDAATPDGGMLRLFVKDLSWSRFDKGPLERRRSAELALYRDILADSPLELAPYFGSVAVEPHGPYLLVLGHIEGSELRSHGLPYWLLATEWLGRLHAFAAEHPEVLQAASGRLIDYDLRALKAVAARAAAHVERTQRHLAIRFEKVLRRYEPWLEDAAAHRTLVHGAYRPQNILVTTEPPPRVIPVDWETAGLGPMYLDLAYFMDGFDSPEREELWGRYRAGAARGGLRVAADRSVWQTVDTLRIHRVMVWLSHAGSRAPGGEKVRELVERAEDLAASRG